MECGAGVWRYLTPFFLPYSNNHSWAWSPTPNSQSARASYRHTLVGDTGYSLSVAPYQTVSHLLLLVTYVTVFHVVLIVCEDRNAKKRLVYSLITLGAFEAFYGLVQYLTGWQQIFAYVKKYYLEDATGTYINR